MYSSATPHASGGILLCESDKLRCPRCLTLVARTTLEGGYMFAVCDGRLNRGARCNAHLFIASASYIQAVDNLASVSVVTQAERDQIRDTARLAQRHAREREKISA